MTCSRSHVTLIPRALLALSLLLAGCRDGQRAPAGDGAAAALPTVQMRIGSRDFTLEVAETDETRARGLMRRDSMPADHGMIFVFPEARELGFYMKNTRIPLDIVYVGADARVISIKQMKPYDLTTTPSDGPAKWAIELNQGTAKSVGLKPGHALDIPDRARHAAE